MRNASERRFYFDLFLLVNVLKFRYRGDYVFLSYRLASHVTQWILFNFDQDI